MGAVPQYDKDSVLGPVPVVRDRGPAVAKPSTWKNDRFERIVTAAEFAADLITVFLAAEALFWVRSLLHHHMAYTAGQMVGGGLGLALVVVLLLDREDAYHHGNSLLRVKETERVLRVCAFLLLVLYAGAWVLPVVSRAVAVELSVITVVSLLAEKHAAYAILRWLHGKGFGVRPVLIYGSGHCGRRIFSALCRSPKLGLDPIAVVDDQPNGNGDRVFNLAYTREKSAPVIRGPLTRELVRQLNASIVIVAQPTLPRERFDDALAEAVAGGAKFALVPDHFLSSDLWMEYADIDGLLLASFGAPSERPSYSALKRGFDVVVSTAIFLFLLPLWAVTVLIIRLDSPGPALFLQDRVGKDGKIFRMFKFRTMHLDAQPYGLSPKSPEDERITRIGRFLRRTSFDEIPQLLNIMRGDMSLVGPRPEMPFIVQQYTAHDRKRLAVTPGLTGLWQISADRAFLIHENIEYDLYYIRNRNFFMDLAIMLHTALFAMRGI